MIWVPNVITPKKDNNNRFLPRFQYVKSENYAMRIFNRFGLLVFETTDITEPWDGLYKGKPVAAGAYVYMIQYTGDDGFAQIKTGTVTVLK